MFLKVCLKLSHFFKASLSTCETPHVSQMAVSCRWLWPMWRA